MNAVLGPLIVVVVVFGATGAWVYRDALRCAEEGAPVVLRVGTLVVSTPGAWLIGCGLLWIFFFPMYVVSRNR